MSKKIYLCTNNFYTLFGTVSEIPVGPGGGEIPVGPGGGGLTHSCTTLGSIDCFCEPHCISGISCTSGWY